MTFAVGHLGGGVKPQGSGDAGMTGQAQAGQTSQGLLAPGREPNSRSGAVTTVTLAIQAADHIGGSVRSTIVWSGHGPSHPGAGTGSTVVIIGVVAVWRVPTSR
jgi:hypothetical protein